MRFLHSKEMNRPRWTPTLDKRSKHPDAQRSAFIEQILKKFSVRPSSTRAPVNDGLGDSSGVAVVPSNPGLAAAAVTPYRASMPFVNAEKQAVPISPPNTGVERA